MKQSVIFLVFVLFLISCGDDTAELDVNVRLAYNEDPLVMTEAFEYPDGRTIKFNRISFFISNLTISDGVQNQLLIDAKQINLTQSHTDTQGAQQGINILSETIDLDQISELSFNLGLTPEQNGLTPTDYPNSSDLSNSAEYWLGWSSYVFAKIEGLIDLDNDGETDSTFALHLGSDQVMRSISFNTLDSDGGDYQLDLTIDVADIFADQSEVYDIVTTTNIHSPAQLEEANFLINNWKDAIDNSLD